ncbi:unnamed protein product [Cladocopium goreaui]|uniref:Uncharacterized protein n=1 Tax=Cladocopium goreaui TaxID=2562237 RepID=A0A9P1FTJ7_9DINO|nr:unnamed protein product [Cladocopium goreaui]
MAMQRRGRVRATTPGRAQAFLGMAAATLLLVAMASDAFVTVVPPSVVQKPGPVSIVLNRASRLPPTTAEQSFDRLFGLHFPSQPSVRAPAQEQATGLLRTTAATALLCLAVTSARRGSKASPKVRVQAVMCNDAARTAVEAKAPAQVTEQVALLDLEVCQENLPAAIVAPVSMAPVAKQHHKARMVGQSRHSKHRSAWAARSAFAAGAKKARRTVGKKLQATTQPVPVAQASFDPSTVRNSVQIGLRISSTLRSEKGRESKSPSSLEGSDMSTGLRIQANEFRE